MMHNICHLGCKREMAGWIRIAGSIYGVVGATIYLRAGGVRAALSPVHFFLFVVLWPVFAVAVIWSKFRGAMKYRNLRRGQ